MTFGSRWQFFYVNSLLPFYKSKQRATMADKFDVVSGAFASSFRYFKCFLKGRSFSWVVKGCASRKNEFEFGCQ